MDMAYVLWADILGFSATIERQAPSDRHQLIDDWAALVREAKNESSIAGASVVHTDACLAYAENSEGGLKSLVVFAKFLLSWGTRIRLPVRGAIACGRIHGSEPHYIDDVVQQARAFEEETSWIGIACTEQTVVPETLWGWHSLVCYWVPCKKAPARALPVVAWDVPAPTDLLRCVTERSGKGEVKVNWRMINKIQPTAQFGRYLQLSGEPSRKPDTAPDPLVLLE